jgi:hypothetical protein
MVLNIVQWTSLFHRINPILLVRSDEFGDHVGRRGLQATDCAKQYSPIAVLSTTSWNRRHHSFLPELQVLGLPPVAVAAKLECQPIQWQTSSSPRLQSVPGPRQTAAALLGTLTRARAPHVGPRDGSRYL